MVDYLQLSNPRNLSNFALHLVLELPDFPWDWLWHWYLYPTHFGLEEIKLSLSLKSKRKVWNEDPNCKGPLISLCWIISIKCPRNLNFPLLTSNQNKGSPKQPISMKRGSKFVGHSTDIIRQSKLKGPLATSNAINRAKRI